MLSNHQGAPGAELTHPVSQDDGPRDDAGRPPLDPRQPAARYATGDTARISLARCPDRVSRRRPIRSHDRPHRSHGGIDPRARTAGTPDNGIRDRAPGSRRAPVAGNRGTYLRPRSLGGAAGGGFAHGPHHPLGVRGSRGRGPRGDPRDPLSRYPAYGTLGPNRAPKGSCSATYTVSAAQEARRMRTCLGSAVRAAPTRTAPTRVP